MATNNLTTEQLLAPRIKVMVKHPFSTLKEGETLEFQKVNGEWLSSSGLIRLEWFDEYPAIFRRMNWAEERKPEDLPEYVKWINDVAAPWIYEVERVRSWNNVQGVIGIIIDRTGEPNFRLTSTTLPATVAEYESFKTDNA